MDRILVTPFRFDRAVPAMVRLGGPSAWVNRPPLPIVAGLTGLATIAEPLAVEVLDTLAVGDRPISIAGDCCTVIGVIAGLQRAGISPRLLWLDAHGDFNTPETSPSGSVGGMALAMLVGRGDQAILRYLEARPLPEADVILADARDLDPLERIALSTSGVVRIAEIEALGTLSLGERALHVHLDVDVLNPADAPAVYCPASGGARLASLIEVLQQVLASARPVSVSLTTWRLDRDAERQTEEACMQVLAALMGPRRSRDRA